MNTEEIVTQHPAARAVITGGAPRPARMAAAKGMLPLPQSDLLEVLVCLAQTTDDVELSAAARETFAAQDTENLLTAVGESGISPAVLAFVAETEGFASKIYESVLSHAKTPDESVVRFAQKTADGALLELLTVNQQRLIRNPSLLDAILTNSARTAEAERRAKETKQEFFEKSRGAQQIVDELRARGDDAAAEFLEKAEFATNLSEDGDSDGLTIEDAVLLASHIEVPDSEVDDSWLAFDFIEEIYEETEEQRRALAEKIISESSLDGEIAPDRIALIRRVLMMGIKDRVKLAIKGDREARSILIRDPNKIVAQAVLANPRITEQEIEKIAAMRTVPDDCLRSIGNNRNWGRNYTIIHNLVRNPRCPLPTAMTILTRIQAKDLQGIVNNRNVSEAVRKQAFRMLAMRR